MTSNASLEGNTRISIAGKYLTFTLGKGSFGIAVLKVREIIKLVPITVVPQMPDYIKGVLNLRGKIIPVADLRVRFGLPATDPTERTCIVVVQVESGKASSIQMGLIVDAVEEVTNVAPEDIEETPDFGTKVDIAYLLALAKVKGAVKTLLNMDRVLSDPVLQDVAKAA